MASSLKNRSDSSRKPGPLAGPAGKSPKGSSGGVAPNGRTATLRHARQTPAALRGASSSPQSGTTRAGHGLTVVLLALVLAGALLILSPGYVLIVMLGLAPTFALLALESDWVWSHLACLVMTNSAGVVLATGFLYHAGGGTEAALGLLGNPNIWVLMYGGAALGYGLAWSIPLLTQGLVELDAMRRRAQIEKIRKELRQEWSLPDDS